MCGVITLALVRAKIWRVNAGFVAFTQTIIVANGITENFARIYEERVGCRLLIGDRLVSIHRRRTSRAIREGTVGVHAVVTAVINSRIGILDTPIEDATVPRPTCALTRSRESGAIVFAPSSEPVFKVKPSVKRLRGVGNGSIRIDRVRCIVGHDTVYEGRRKILTRHRRMIAGSLRCTSRRHQTGVGATGHETVGVRIRSNEYLGGKRVI